MSEQEKELWRELCEQAAVEQDPQKLHALVGEIIRVLEAKETAFPATEIVYRFNPNRWPA
jgi:hypothetical protein